MKALFTLLALLFCLTGLKAQNTVTIPDAGFVAWLQTNIPTAMNGNQMDITNTAVTTRTAVNVQVTQLQNYNISNLTGIQYFTSLIFLNTYGNSITILPSLPASLDSLFCVGTSPINSLPPNLKKLMAGSSNLISLPTLPTSLKFLSVYSQSLTALPALPNGLEYLACGSSPGLINHVLPPLPNTLKYLHCSLFKLDSLPTLPNSLISLDCQMNLITQLPTLPNNLEYLNCSYLQLNSIPTLPTTLKSLICMGNNSFTTLPILPSSLTTLACGGGSLSILPALPNGLKEITCNYSPHINLPAVLPYSLEKLDCRSDSLTHLPQLPNNLKTLMCSNNQITCIPTLPNSLTYIDILNNPISCLPNYLTIMDATYFTYPLCIPGNTITNPNGCERANGVIGNAYFDTNTNCLRDTNDTKLKNINFKLFDSNNLYLNQASSYSFGMYNFTYPNGDYTVVLDTLNTPYTAQCVYPGIDTTIQLTAINPTVENVDFSVKCKPGFDVGVQSVLTNGIVFPGQNHNLKIAAGDMSQWYNLNCASGVSGQLTINVSGPVTYIAPALGSLTPIVSGTIFTYNIADFGSINFLSDFSIVLKTDTTATSDDSICVSVNITPISGDSDISNNSYNLCYGVVNSYDPNMKEVYPINVESGYEDWFTYTIHFQNTGNAPAFNIRLIDTLDANLDLETFKVINYSHNNTWSINHKVAFFNFQNIQLPDSTSDSEGSKGFIQYKIKPKSNLGAGTKIKNTAYIYFDYNSPIITNTTINEYIQVVSVKENFKELQSFVYPNPTSGLFTIELPTEEKQSFQVFDITGNVVLSQSIENGKAIIDASHLAAGVYTINIKGNSTVINKKVVIVK